jgi:hypothetical protein
LIPNFILSISSKVTDFQFYILHHSSTLRDQGQLQ